MTGLVPSSRRPGGRSRPIGEVRFAEDGGTFGDDFEPMMRAAPGGRRGGPEPVRRQFRPVVPAGAPEPRGGPRGPEPAPGFRGGGGDPDDPTNFNRPRPRPTGGGGGGGTGGDGGSPTGGTGTGSPSAPSARRAARDLGVTELAPGFRQRRRRRSRSAQTLGGS